MKSKHVNMRFKKKSIILKHLLKEWELIKINNRGKRQVRILGINQFRIYNKTKEKDVKDNGELL